MDSGQLTIRPFLAGDEREVVGLWSAAGLVVPSNNPEEDIRRKVAFQPDLFLVGLLEGRVAATCMAGYDGHRGWINYLAVRPDCRGRGHAARIMAAAQEKLLALGCPKINLQVRRTNKAAVGFYLKTGFSDDRVISFGKRLIEDPPFREE